MVSGRQTQSDAICQLNFHPKVNTAVGLKSNEACIKPSTKLYFREKDYSNGLMISSVVYFTYLIITVL